MCLFFNVFFFPVLSGGDLQSTGCDKHFKMGDSCDYILAREIKIADNVRSLSSFSLPFYLFQIIHVGIVGKANLSFIAFFFL